MKVLKINTTIEKKTRDEPWFVTINPFASYFYDYVEHREYIVQMTEEEYLEYIRWKGEDYLKLVKYHNEQLKPSILEDKEKEYLRNAIRLFRDKVKHIVKGEIFFANCSKEYIAIALQERSIIFPNFEKGTMYKGMELDKYYTLEELGL